MTKAKTNEVVTIKAPNIQMATFNLVGTAPFVMNKFSRKAREEMHANQAAGSQAKSKKKREPKDFDAAYEQAFHRSEDGWIGIPAPSFRAAMIDACRLVGFKMTLAKQAVFIVHDGLDADEGTPLVKLEAGEPEKYESLVRNATGVPDIRVRPMWRRWGAQLTVRFDADVFSRNDVANLLARAGLQVGVGEGRPFSKNSAGQGWGTFELR